MKKIINNIVFQGFLAGVLGVISSCLMVYAYTLALKATGFEVTNDETINIILQASLQVFLITFVLWIAGKKLAPKLNLNVGLKVEKNNVLISCIVGLLLAVITVFGDKFVFEPSMGVPLVYDKGIMTNLYLLLYSGFVEEVWFRLGGITILSFAIHYGILGNKEERKGLALKIAVPFIVLLFFLINFFGVQSVYYTVPIVLIKSVVFYALPAVIFSIIFIKKGLVYSIISHMSMIFIAEFILIPILLKI